LAALEVKAGAERLILREQEAMAADEAFWGPGGAAGEGNEGGGPGWKVGGIVLGISRRPTGGEWKWRTGVEGVFEAPKFKTEKLRLGTANESFWREPVEALLDEVGAFGWIDENDDEPGVKATEKNLVQFDGDGMENENGVAFFETLFTEEVGSALDAGVEFAEGDGAFAVDDGGAGGIVVGELFGEIHFWGVTGSVGLSSRDLNRNSLQAFGKEGVTAEDGGVEAGTDSEGLVVFALEGVDGLGEASLTGLLLDVFDEKGAESGKATLGKDGEGFDDET